MGETILIPARFNGPPRSANGGYASGAVAALLGGAAEVTLRRPPPLDVELTAERSGGRVLVRDGEALVAEADALASFELDLPAPVSLVEAEAARECYPGFRKHAYATCYVCGPERTDGLGIFPGAVAGSDLVAAPWSPPAGEVPREVVWAALDCPSGWAIDQFSRRGVLLGRLAARVVAAPAGGQTYVVVGWPRGEDGRRRFAGSALFGADGSVHAFARSTWIVSAT